MRFRSALPLALALLTCGAPEGVGTRRDAVYGGVDTPGAVTLDAAQRAGLGALEFEGRRVCTTWLLSPSRAVTAGHCVAHLEPPLDLDVVLTPAGHEAAARVPVTAFEAHPTLDLAVLHLGATLDATTRAPLRRAAGASDLPRPGARVEAAGAGLGNPVDRLVQFATFEVLALEPSTLLVTGDGGTGLCRGDSGGPFMVPGGEGPLVVAASSTGGADCLGPDRGARVDLAAPWLDAWAVAPPGPPALPCAGETAAWCEGDVAWRCLHGAWRPEDCTAAGRTCGETGGGKGCLPAPCGRVDVKGTCVGAVATWCEQGALSTDDCGRRGLGCEPATTPHAACVACTACDGRCVSLASDPRHCGTCQVQCVGACVEGTCQAPAPADPPSTTTPSSCSASPGGRAAWEALILLAGPRLLRRRARHG